MTGAGKRDGERRQDLVPGKPPSNGGGGDNKGKSGQDDKPKIGVATATNRLGKNEKGAEENNFQRNHDELQLLS